MPADVRVVAVVQARTGSSRLPGKVLKWVGRQTVLTHTLARAKLVRGVDAVHVTTTPSRADDVVCNLCRGAAVSWTRGQAPLGPGRNDVLAGYLEAARATRADVVVRLTSDCPLLDPVVVEAVLGRFLEAGGRGYASNVDPPSWYDGCDVEVLDVDTLAWAAENASAGQREHVTTLVREARPNLARDLRAPQDWSWLKLSVDDATDLERVRRVWRAISSHQAFGWRDVVRAYFRAFPPGPVAAGYAVYGRNGGLASRVDAYARGAVGVPLPEGRGDAERHAWVLGAREASRMPPHEFTRLAALFDMEDGR